MKLLNSLLQIIFPNTCVTCNSISPEGEYFCDFCYEMLPQTGRDNLCRKCGLDEKSCNCKYNVYYFDGCVAPFYTTDTAKEAMYKYKFNKNERIAGFFAEKMVTAVKQSFNGINFDLVTYVPMTEREKIKRGYNQSEILARKISKIMDKPFAKGLIKCNEKKEKQHNLNYKERLKNVAGVYFCKENLSGKCILLVDDIKTTGATLSECSKQLLKCGASSVYCVTGLVSKSKKGKKDGN